MKRWLIGIAFAAAALGGLYAATLAGAGIECQACVVYEGREACKAATGASRDEAERSAIATACAVVTGGVTRSIECQSFVPLSLECADR